MFRKQMERGFFLVFVLSCFIFQIADAQSYDIVIKGGHVIDPKNHIDEKMDVAVKDGKIVAVAKSIDAKGARQVVDAEGLYVTPGLIDIHTHDFWGVNMNNAYMDGPAGIMPDNFTFRNGVTTVVDAGSSGWRTFPVFKKQTIEVSKTRVLAFLNIVGEGMRGGGPYQQDQKDMDPEKTAEFAKAHAQYIVGIKLAHYNGHDWTPVKRAEKAATLAEIPLMVDFGGAHPPLSLDTLFTRVFRPGDIFTHCFAQLRGREFIVDTATGKVKPFVWKARKKGVIFDVGYGGISFAFSQAIPAAKEGFFPNSISTDLHMGDYNAAMKNILNIMSKFLVMGMDMQQVIQATTWNPAREIQRKNLGNLSVGSVADIALLRLRQGNFGFFDYTGYKLEGNQKLECEMTIRGGKIVYDLNAIATPVVLNHFGE